MAWRNARRNLRRSSLTAATVALGSCLLIIGLSWLSGILQDIVQSSIQAHGQVRLTTARFAQKEALFPIEENLPETASIIQTLQKNPSVRIVYPRINMPVAASVRGEELGEVFGLLQGAPLGYFRDELEFERYILHGSFPKASSEVLLGKSLARDMDVHIGEEAIFLGTTQDGSLAPIKAKIAGILETGNSLFDKQAYMEIEPVRWMADIPDGATELLIYGTSADSIRLQESVASLKTTLTSMAGAYTATGEEATLEIRAWSQREPFRSLFQIVSFLNACLAGIIIFVTALGVLNTMMMSVLERRKEIGILRAMGMDRRSIASLFLFEAFFISMAGGFIGVTLGSYIALEMGKYGVDLGNATTNAGNALPLNSVFYPSWTPELALLTFALGIVMALFGSLIPIWEALRVQPVEAFR